MPIDISLVSSDDLMTFEQAAKLVPGRTPHKNTLHRWCKQGVRGVILESVIVNGYRYTTEAALKEFLAAVSNPTLSKSDKRSRARKKLRAVGI